MAGMSFSLVISLSFSMFITVGSNTSSPFLWYFEPCFAIFFFTTGQMPIFPSKFLSFLRGNLVVDSRVVDRALAAAWLRGELLSP
mmetsp:Transcript_10333/g.25996  ORF Transcript_10333/g.25996 Transcript_10333/m.25996 type:complete len:85 (+) Transcript_10333:297-551(+)